MRLTHKPWNDWVRRARWNSCVILQSMGPRCFFFCIYIQSCWYACDGCERQLLWFEHASSGYMFWVTTTGCGIWVGQWLHVCCCSIFMWVIAVSQEPLICSLLELLSFRSSGLVGLQSGNTLCLGGGKMEDNSRIFCVTWQFLVPWLTENGKKKIPN